MLSSSARRLCSALRDNIRVRASSSSVLDQLNPRIVSAEYAVRGAIVMEAESLKEQLARGASLPFSGIIQCNIGNPQELGQRPLTFPREVLSLIEFPELLKNPPAVYTDEAVARARSFLQRNPRGTGPYSHSQGLPSVRESVARFIQARDGHSSDPSCIFMSDGASPGIQSALALLLRSERDGIMTPVPQYPLYSASITMCGGQKVPYFLDEANDWGLTIDELERAYQRGKKQGVDTRALVIINPGNPTGGVLSEANVREIIEFCARKNIVLLADEVYQDNVYSAQSKFHSFKKALRELNSRVPLLSFHSVSKGVFGECGKRGGYMELANIAPEMHAQLYKAASVKLCPNISGQVMMDLVLSGPPAGSPAAKRHATECQAILESLKRRAVLLVKALNELEGVTCNPPQGAMYAFPRITLPPKLLAKARESGTAADALYCLELLRATGICVVPGSGFGQMPDTWHFRTTFLPSEDDIGQVVERMAVFHRDFLQRWG